MKIDQPKADIGYAITKEDVFKACDVLWSRKDNPSPEKVRGTLGKGSLATINKYLKLWREEEWDQQPPDTLIKAINELRRLVKSEANELIKKHQQQSEQEISLHRDQQHAIELEHEATVKELRVLQSFSDNLKEAHQSLNQKYGDEEKKRYLAEQTNQSLEKELQQAKQNSAEQLNAQAKEYEKNISDLRNQIEQNQNQFDEKILSLNKKHDEQKESLNHQITDLRLKTQELTQVLSQAKVNEQSYIAGIEKINAKYLKSQEEVNNLKVEKHIFIQTQHNLEKDLAIMKEMYKQTRFQNEELKKQNDILQQQLVEQGHKIGQLEEKLSSLKKTPKVKAAKS